MDGEQETQDLRKRLAEIDAKIKTDLDRITAVQEHLRTTYRRADGDRYEAERREIVANMEKYEAEQDAIRKRLAELEVLA